MDTKPTPVRHHKTRARPSKPSKPTAHTLWKELTLGSEGAESSRAVCDAGAGGRGEACHERRRRRLVCALLAAARRSKLDARCSMLDDAR
eukprot:125768-Rhodomonas_salina.1